jgi:hypothetical protein
MTIAPPERQTTCQSCDRSVSVLSTERALRQFDRVGPVLLGFMGVFKRD